MSVLSAGANAAVAAWALRAKILAHLTVLSHPARLAVASVIIDQLAAISGAMTVTGIRQTLVDISFAAWPSEAWRTLTLEAAHPVNTNSTMVTGTGVALVHVDLAKLASGPWRAGAGEPVHQIIAYPTIHARIGLAVVNIMLALSSHEARGAAAAVLRLQIVAGGSVLTGIGRAGVGLVLAIGAPIAMPALTGMRGTHVAALAAMLTQPGHGGVAVVGSNLAAHHLHITKLACPAGGTGAHIAGSVLYAGPALLTRAAGTPVHHLVTVRASEPGLAEALVGAVDAFTCSIVFARAAVAGVYPALAVGAREALLAEAAPVAR